MLRRHKRLVGALTIWPFIWFALQVASTIYFATQNERFVLSLAAGDGESGLLSLLLSIPIVLATFAGGMVAIASIVVLFVWFIVDACQSPQIPETERVTWILLLVLGNVLALPIYWYLKIWRDPPAAVAYAPAAS
jgi:hypothetical protein